MFTEPYQTTALAMFHPQVKRLTDQLETNYIQGHLHPAQLNAEGPVGSVVEIMGGDHITIDTLVAPKVIQTNDGMKVVIDVRGSKRAVLGGSTALTNPGDYKFALREAQLVALWNSEGPYRFSALDILPIRVYARWVADGLARRLDLNAFDALHVQVLAAYYYLCQFRNPGDETGSTGQLGFANLISRALNARIEDVMRSIDGLGILTDAASFVATVQGDGSNVRLGAINVGLLYTMLSAGWFGARARYIAAVAIEYPPTFLAMLYSAYNDRSYRSSFFAKTAEAANKGNLARDFVLAMNHLSRGLSDG